MAVTTIGVKIDEELKARLKRAADGIGRSPHWLIKQGIFSVLERVERGEALAELLAPAVDIAEAPANDAPQPPFLEFAQTVQPQSVLRAKITAAYRRPETECLPLLIADATLPKPVTSAARDLARKLVEALRDKSQSGGVEGLIHEYSLSSQEGVALMCLAEALLRIPDRATRDALIRDKIGHGDWEAHLGHSPSLFVNAATWGLLITGRLTGTSSGKSLSSALTKLIARGGEPPPARPSLRRWPTAVHGKRRASAIPTTCWARRRRRPPMRSAITPITNRRSTPSARRRPSEASTMAPGFRSNSRLCIHATTAPIWSA